MDVRPDDGSRLPSPEPDGLTAELARLRAEVEHLRLALAGRAVIEQAKGILAERTRCTPEAAFALLDQMSQRRNVKLRLIAAEVVAGRGGSAPADLGDGTDLVDVGAPPGEGPLPGAGPPPEDVTG